MQSPKTIPALNSQGRCIQRSHSAIFNGNPKYHLSVRTFTVVHWCSPLRITKAINCECETHRCMRVGERCVYLIYGAILQLYHRLYINVKRILTVSTFGPVMFLSSLFLAFSLHQSVFLHTGILYCKPLWIAPFCFLFFFPNVKYLSCNSKTFHLNQFCVNLNVSFTYLPIFFWCSKCLALAVLFFPFQKKKKKEIYSRTWCSLENQHTIIHIINST